MIIITIKKKPFYATRVAARLVARSATTRDFGRATFFSAADKILGYSLLYRRRIFRDLVFMRFFRATRLASAVALGATDAEPPTNALPPVYIHPAFFTEGA